MLSTRKQKSSGCNPPPARPSTYRFIAESSRGDIWLSSGWNGVQRFDPASGRFTVYRHSERAGSLSSDAVNAICVDHSGIVWAGTQVGLTGSTPRRAFSPLMTQERLTVQLTGFWKTPAAISGGARTAACYGSVRVRRPFAITILPMGWRQTSLGIAGYGRTLAAKCSSDRTAA